RVGDIIVMDREIWLPGFQQHGFDLGPEQVQVMEIRVEPVDVEMHLFPATAGRQWFRGMNQPDSGCFRLEQRNEGGYRVPDKPELLDAFICEHGKNRGRRLIGKYMKPDKAGRRIVENPRNELLGFGIPHVNIFALQVHFLVVVEAQTDKVRIEHFAVHHHPVILIEMAIECLRPGSGRSEKDELLTRLHFAPNPRRPRRCENTPMICSINCAPPHKSDTAGAVEHPPS
ncbi:MAG: hypothetical protein ABJB10_19950, partial [Mesorhizobium sp.]